MTRIATLESGDSASAGLPAQMRKLIVSLPLTNDLNATSSLSINLPFNRPNRCGDYSAGSGLGASWTGTRAGDSKRVVTASDDHTARIWDVTWATLIRDDALRERVCAEKLIGAAQEFSATELEDPILRGIDKDDPIARNPCLRRGPLSLDYWARLAASRVPDARGVSERYQHPRAVAAERRARGEQQPLEA